jgi:hypothetical protein
MMVDLASTRKWHVMDDLVSTGIAWYVKGDLAIAGTLPGM